LATGSGVIVAVQVVVVVVTVKKGLTSIKVFRTLVAVNVDTSAELVVEFETETETGGEPGIATTTMALMSRKRDLKSIVEVNWGVSWNLVRKAIKQLGPREEIITTICSYTVTISMTAWPS